MTMDEFQKLWAKLEKSGRVAEICGPSGVVPSERALESVERQYRLRPTAEKYRLAQAQTMMDFAEKYQAELN